jgi:hypothetical protein
MKILIVDDHPTDLKLISQLLRLNGHTVYEKTQSRPENFCDPHDARYDLRYVPIARRPRRKEIRQAYRCARDLGLRFESLSYEKNTTGLRA